MAKKYMVRIIRNILANQRGINPSDVDMVEVVEIYETDSLEKYKIREVEVLSYENGKEVRSVVCGLVDRVTGFEYYSNVIS